jgi:hypothetical protein
MLYMILVIVPFRKLLWDSFLSNLTVPQLFIFYVYPLTRDANKVYYTKIMFSNNFRIYEKKLSRRHVYLVYKGKSWTLQNLN